MKFITVVLALTFIFVGFAKANESDFIMLEKSGCSSVGCKFSLYAFEDESFLIHRPSVQILCSTFVEDGSKRTLKKSEDSRLCNLPSGIVHSVSRGVFNAGEFNRIKSDLRNHMKSRINDSKPAVKTSGFKALDEIIVCSNSLVLTVTLRVDGSYDNFKNKSCGSNTKDGSYYDLDNIFEKIEQDTYKSIRDTARN